jgi:hypothetical protein
MRGSVYKGYVGLMGYFFHLKQYMTASITLRVTHRLDVCDCGGRYVKIAMMLCDLEENSIPPSAISILTSFHIKKWRFRLIVCYSGMGIGFCP